MSYDPPDFDLFITTYPEFSETQPGPVRRALTEAGRQVDDTWIEEDYQPAIMALAAHLLSARTFGEESFGQDDIRALSIGPLSISFGGKISVSELQSTVYGQDFVSIRGRNVGGPVAITM